jgi:hypothetical protein
VATTTAVAVAAVAATARSAPPVLTCYTWAQPGATATAAPNAQPPAWVLDRCMSDEGPLFGYTWLQPGAVPVVIPNAQPPAWVPIA